MKPFGSCHVRIHLVTLSREYSVSEGGFAIGLWDDFRESEKTGQGFVIRSHELESCISTASNVSFSYTEMRPQPGMHLMAPYAAYPAYRTGMLEAGTYLFASVIGIHKVGQGQKLPRISIDGDEVMLDGNVVLGQNQIGKN